MEIDLSKVLACSQDNPMNMSRSMMRSIMLDLYPEHTREMNILLDVYESGIPRKIMEEGSITDIQYVQYIQKIVDDYGIQSHFAKKALDSWIDACIIPGTAAGINVEYEELDNGELEIVRFTGFDYDEVAIPKEIKGKRVIGIGSFAFDEGEKLEHVIVQEGIEYVSDWAFAYCSNLVKIDLPTTLVELGIYVFHSDKALEEIDLPNGIETIESASFSYCYRLEKVLFPDNLREIGGCAFYRCTCLREVILPPKVESIEKGAFAFSGVQRVVLNEGLKRIGDAAFAFTPELKFIAIPRSVIEFGNDIFITEHGGNREIVIGCYPDSRAFEYAQMNNLRMKDMSKE